MGKITDVKCECDDCNCQFTVLEGHNCECGEILCPACHGNWHEVKPQEIKEAKKRQTTASNNNTMPKSLIEYIESERDDWTDDRFILDEVLWRLRHS